MTPNEHLILKNLEKYGGKASITHLAKEAKLSLPYTGSLCKNLARQKYVVFLGAGVYEIQTRLSHPQGKDHERIFNCAKCSGVLLKVITVPQFLGQELVLEIKCPHCAAFSRISVYYENQEKCSVEVI